MMNNLFSINFLHRKVTEVIGLLKLWNLIIAVAFFKVCDILHLLHKHLGFFFIKAYVTRLV